LEDQLTDKAQVIRLDVWSRVGRQAGDGQPVYGRYGIPVPGQVVEQVDILLAASK
jgi:hypothetical protein